MIGVINLGNSNLMSLTNSLDFLSVEYVVIDKANMIAGVDSIILPGVGSFRSGVERLHSLRLYDELRKVVLDKKPILGICLGMQLLFESSSESPGAIGLGLLEGCVVNLPLSEQYRTPRIGWAESKLNDNFLSLENNSLLDFYYIHSFHVIPKNFDIVSISTAGNVTAAVNYQNIFGCQFHPEKSHINGLKILNDFSKLKAEHFL